MVFTGKKKMETQQTSIVDFYKQLEKNHPEDSPGELLAEQKKLYSMSSGRQQQQQHGRIRPK